MRHLPVIDGFEFASAGATQQGSLPLSGFPRLRDLLVSDAGEVAYEVKGLRDARGRPGLRVRVRGMLELRCQRCLEAMQFEVDEEEMLVLAATQDEIDADPVDTQAPDRILAEKEMAVRDLIEDELILSLPLALRHEECAADAADADGEKPAPFGGLRNLFRNRH